MSILLAELMDNNKKNRRCFAICYYKKLLFFYGKVFTSLIPLKQFYAESKLLDLVKYIMSLPKELVH